MLKHTNPLGFRHTPNPISMKKLLPALPLLAFATLGCSAPLLVENFDSLNITDLNGQNGWTADAALDVASGGLSYTKGIISIDGGDKHATWSGANVQPLGSKAFASQSSEVWFSLTINVTATDTSSRFWFYVSNDADLADAGVVGQINSNSTALAAGSRIGSSQAISANSSLNAGNTVFIVGRFSQTGITTTVGDYDKMEMWVNPDSTSLGVAFTATNPTGTTGGITGGIDTFALTALGTGSTVLWDNLRVGTTQADVLDVYVIPEPSTYTAFGGLAAMSLVVLRRRATR